MWVILYVLYIMSYTYIYIYPPPCLARVRVMGLRNVYFTLWACLVLTKGPPHLLTASIEAHRSNRGPQKVFISPGSILISFRIGPRNGAKIFSHPSPTPPLGRRWVARMSFWVSEVVFGSLFETISGLGDLRGRFWKPFWEKISGLGEVRAGSGPNLVQARNRLGAKHGGGFRRAEIGKILVCSVKPVET